VTGRVVAAEPRRAMKSRLSALRRYEEVGDHGTEMFHKELDEVVAGTMRGSPGAASSGRMWSAGRCWRSRGALHRTRSFWRGVCAEERGRGRHKAFFTGLSAAVLRSDDGCNGHITLPEGVEMVMPGITSILTVELIVPVALEQGSKFWPFVKWLDRRLRRRHQNMDKHGLTKDFASASKLNDSSRS